jgi:predicted nucleic acid-binding protein
MKSGDSKLLVIDASVAGAAGRTDHPVSKACRDFLEGVRKICHRVVMTREISDEWHRHQSNFALSWRSSMFAKNKVARPEVAPNEILRTNIQNSGLSKKACAAALKDAHLVEAALESDLRVVSLDETARAVFRKVAPRVGPLRPVLWANPTKEEDHIIEWLEGGAKDEEVRQLGFDDCV